MRFLTLQWYCIAAAVEQEGETMTKETDKLLADIAKKHLRFETPETRKSDSLDFKDCGVWCIKAALEEAYETGRAAALAPLKKKGS